MKEQKKLTIQMSIFAFIIFICFGIIILTEKMAPYYSYKIDEKLNKYLKENYASIINELEIGNTNYKNTEYQLKIASAQNSNLYFYLKYSNKKITDTYQEDYLKGKTLLTNTSNSIAEELEKKYKKNFKITILTTLDNFSNQTKEKIIKEENVSSLPIYTLETDLIIPMEIENIIKEINSLHNTLQQDNVNPKNYNFIIIDKNKKQKTLKINNLSKDIIENNEILTTIIYDIINDNDDSNILNKYNITYEQIKE